MFYISEVGSVGNIWSLPLDGALPAPVTHFKSHSLSYFSWSPDRKRLAVARRTEMSDVVLIENLASR